MRHVSAGPLGRLALLVAVVATGCATTGPEQRDWLRLETPDYIVLSTLGEARTRLVARDFELFHAGLSYILGAELRLGGRKVTVYAIDDTTFVSRFDIRNRPSYFLATLDGPVVVLRTGGGFAGDADPEMLHELTHFLVRQTDRRRPLWYEEGIAQMASTIRPRGGHAQVAPPRIDHVATLRDWARSDIDPTLALSDLTRPGPRDRTRFLAESWALAHYATLSLGRLEKPDQRPFSRFRHALDNGAGPGQAARIALGTRGEELSGLVRDYIQRDAVQVATVVPSHGWSAADAKLEALSRADGRWHLGRLSAALGRWKDAGRFFRMLPESDPRRAGAMAGAYRGLDITERAREEIASALERAPEDPRVQLEAGLLDLALAERDATSRARHLASAREAFDRAITHRTTRLAALAARARSQLVEGEDATAGLALVARARRSMPGSLELQLLEARLEAARGRPGPAKLHAIEIASRGHGLPVADEARTLLEALRDR